VRQSELDYFKKMLEARKMQILKNLDDVQDSLDTQSQEELNDEADYASMNNSTLVETAIGEKQNKELIEIEISLAKMANRKYGICEMCEDPISISRLKVKPHARYCIDCREIAEKNEKK
jgi:DnaK suppressor protein